MSGPQLAMTSTELIVSASQVLMSGGYSRVLEREWDTPTTRLFEDEYNVVAVAVCDTCNELLRTWPDLQGSLVELISRHIGREELKAWDGYLALLTPGVAGPESTEIDAIRRNTLRLRKIVATGDELRSAPDIERVLRCLLPLAEVPVSPPEESALDALPRLLAAQGIPVGTTDIIVQAFKEQASLLERLHQQKVGQ